MKFVWKNDPRVNALNFEILDSADIRKAHTITIFKHNISKDSPVSQHNLGYISVHTWITLSGKPEWWEGKME